MPETLTHPISYTRPASQVVVRDLVLLEQARWDAYAGLLTRVNLLRYLAAQFFPDEGEDEQDSFVDCGMDSSGGLTLGLAVYELANRVSWRLLSSVGVLGETTRIERPERRAISFNLAKSASLPHPANRILSARWLTGPYNADGAKIAPPDLGLDTQDRRIVHAPAPIFGSVALTVQVQAAISTVRLDAAAAEQALIAGWSEFAVCLPEGGRPVGLELQAPPGAAELAESSQPCGRHWSIRVTHNNDTPKAKPADKHINCDYCDLQCDEE